MSPVFLLNVTGVRASTSEPAGYGHTSSWNRMTLALPSTWLYSCILHETLPNTWSTLIDGTPPPGQGASCQTANALSAAAVAAARSTFFDAWYCIEYEMQYCGHPTGMPVGQFVSGSISQSLPHAVVRQ